MPITIAHLGPTGTYAEAAAMVYADQLQQRRQTSVTLEPYPSIAKTLQSLAAGNVDYAIVPVENSIEGSVSITLDTLWQLDNLQIQQAIVLPITHALLSHGENLATIRAVYSHPQALAQCQIWLETNLHHPSLIPTSSTTEALRHLDDRTAAAISSQRAAQLYGVPVLACPINDYPDNCTRFWAVSQQASTHGSHTSLAFSLPANLPGALVKALQAFAHLDINLSKIESRPTKRSLGDYLFFIDLEGSLSTPSVQSALQELATCTETLKIFGSYSILTVTALP
ncbi:MAG: prephenate dehydratase [Cyanobacteria bacterium]|nr:prephenate dehydratase [Cyanobacteriota bacterium]MDW8200546.1 prephenate dehydratase [Cyanobacteriota bacterium SKYGB_h_bin112]